MLATVGNSHNNDMIFVSRQNQGLLVRATNCRKTCDFALSIDLPIPSHHTSVPPRPIHGGVASAPENCSPFEFALNPTPVVVVQT